MLLVNPKNSFGYCKAERTSVPSRIHESSPHLQLFQNILDISCTPGLSEALLFQESNLVVEHLQYSDCMFVQPSTITHLKLLQKQLFADWSFKDGRDELLRHNQVIHKLTQLPTHLVVDSDNFFRQHIQKSHRTDCRFFSLKFISTLCCCRLRISVEMLPRSDWKERRRFSIRARIESQLET